MFISPASNLFGAVPREILCPYDRASGRDEDHLQKVTKTI